MEPPLKTLRTGLLTDDESLQSAIAIAISLFVAHSPTLPLLSFWPKIVQFKKNSKN